MNLKNVLSGDLLQYKYVKPKLHLWIFNPSSEPLASRGVRISDTFLWGVAGQSCLRGDFEGTWRLTRMTA